MRPTFSATTLGVSVNGLGWSLAVADLNDDGTDDLAAGATGPKANGSRAFSATPPGCGADPVASTGSATDSAERRCGLVW